MGMDWGPHQAREEPRRPVAHHVGGGPPRPYEQRAFTIGNIVGEAFELYQRFFVYFVTVAAAVFFATDLVSALAILPSSDTAAASILIAGIVISIVGFYAVQGALTVAVEDVRDGRVDVGGRRLVARTRQRLPDLACAGFLIGLLLAVGGFVVYVIGAAAGVPWLGVIVALVGIVFFVTRWSIVTPVVVLENVGPIVGLRRSWGLVRGHSWRAFFIILVTGLIAGISAGILRAIIGAFLSGFPDAWLTSAVANSLTTPFVALAWTLMYFHLRPATAPPATPEIPAGAAYRDE